MKEELISFETAKLAKEVGFDCVTNKYYTPNSGKLVYGIGPVVVNIRIKAPTQSLLQHWLREKHNTLVLINPYKGFDNDGYPHIYSGDSCQYEHENTYLLHWGYAVLKCKENEIPEDISFEQYTENKIINVVRTYEQALEAGLLEALKLIKI